ncbi:MAG: hypothetical protein JO082_07870 [Mycobacterium sp.]|nr:hypothetical protein [Mycobacterium sp.]MBV9721820.1 hypothetical protein [Mycobacterium sp.]
MLKQSRLLLTLGAAAGGLAAAAFLHAPAANADACDGLGGCTLESGGSPTDVEYSGFRPFFEEWTDNQPTNVDAAGSPFVNDVSGSYDVSETDIESPYIDDVTYNFGTFTPAADNSSGIDSDGLSGATVYDIVLDPGGKTVDGATTYGLGNLNVFLADGNHVEITSDPGVFTNYLYNTPTESGDWIEYGGSSTPTLVYDTLANPSFPTELFNGASSLIGGTPDAWLPGFDSMFPPGLL